MCRQHFSDRSMQNRLACYVSGEVQTISPDNAVERCMPSHSTPLHWRRWKCSSTWHRDKAHWQAAMKSELLIIHYYHIDRRIYLNHSKPTQGTVTGPKALKPAANGRYLFCPKYALSEYVHAHLSSTSEKRIPMLPFSTDCAQV